MGEDNLQDAENLKESLDFSRILIDNAKTLYELNKKNSSELFKGFRDSSKVLSKSLQELSLNYDKFLSHEADYKDVLKQIQILEKQSLDLSKRRNLLEGVAISQKKEELAEALKREKQAKDVLDKSAKLSSKFYADRKKSHEEKIKETLESRKQLDLLQSTLDISIDLEQSTLNQINTLKKHSEALGKVYEKSELLRRVYTSISKIPLLGGFVNVEKGVSKYKQAQMLKDAGKLKKGSPMGESLKGAFGIGDMAQMASKVALVVTAFTILAKVVMFFVDSMFQADKQITDISRKMGITKDEAVALRNQFVGISANLGGIAQIQSGIIVSQKEIFQTWIDINDQLNTAVKLDSIFLGQMALISTKIGLSTEAMTGLNLISRAGEKAPENILNSILNTNRLLVLQGKSLIENKKLLEFTLKITGQLRSLYKGNVDEIAKGVIQAQKMATTLEKFNESARGYLDFESSISSELEAQLLTGRNINLDAARYYSLIGDTNNLMTEVQKNFPTWEEFSNLNRIAQEGYAKALNMSVDQMSNMIFEQQTLNKLTNDNKKIIASKIGVEAAGALVTIKTLKEANKVLDKFNITSQIRQEILGEETYLQLQNQSAQDKFNQSIERIKETFSNLVTGGTLDKLADLLVAITNSLSKGITGIFSLDEELVKAQIDRAESIAKGDTIFASKLAATKTRDIYRDREGTQFGTGEEVYDKNKLNVLLQEYSQNKKMDDFIIRGNTVTPFRKDDIVMGGTNLMGGNEELKEINNNIKLLLEAVKSGKDINMDSYKVGTILQLGTAKIQ